MPFALFKQAIYVIMRDDLMPTSLFLLSSFHLLKQVAWPKTLGIQLLLLPPTR